MAIITFPAVVLTKKDVITILHFYYNSGWIGHDDESEKMAQLKDELERWAETHGVNANDWAYHRKNPGRNS